MDILIPIDHGKAHDNRKLLINCVVGGIFVCAIFVTNTIYNYKQKASHFRGVVQRKNFNEKGTLIVMVNGEKYALPTSWRFNDKVAVGDSLIKRSETTVYQLIKRGSGVVIRSDQD